MRLFHARLDPALAKKSAALAKTASDEIEQALDAVTILDEDRILRRYVNLVLSTLRTNYYQPGADGAPKLVDRMTFDSHIDHAVIGLMDPAHGPYVHQNWWWRSTTSQHDKAKAFEAREAGFAMVRHPPSTNSYAYRLLGGAPATEIVFRLPGLRWEHIEIGPRQVLSLTCLTPVNEGQTRITQIMWSDHWAFTLLRPLIAAAARKFLRQDAAMVNLQNEGLVYDPALLWVDDADRQAKWYQALKREWTASRREGRALANPVEGGVLRWRS